MREEKNKKQNYYFSYCKIHFRSVFVGRVYLALCNSDSTHFLCIERTQAKGFSVQIWRKSDREKQSYFVFKKLRLRVYFGGKISPFWARDEIGIQNLWFHWMNRSLLKLRLWPNWSFHFNEIENIFSIGRDCCLFLHQWLWYKYWYHHSHFWVLLK